MGIELCKRPIVIPVGVVWVWQISISDTLDRGRRLPVFEHIQVVQSILAHLISSSDQLSHYLGKTGASPEIRGRKRGV